VHQATNAHKARPTINFRRGSIFCAGFKVWGGGCFDVGLISLRAVESHAKMVCNCPDAVASPLLRMWQRFLGKSEMQQKVSQNYTESYCRRQTCFEHGKAAANTTMPVPQDTQFVEPASGSRRWREVHLQSTVSARPGTSPWAIFAGLAPLTCLEAFVCAN
jgi:hypothetical protein